MSATADIRGLKRICVECGTRFYDMNKRPIKCPSCGNEFTGEVKLKTRKSRVAAADEALEKKAKEAEAAKDDELEEEDEGAEIVSLDDLETVEATEEDDGKKITTDLDVDDDDDDMVPLDDDIASLDDLEPDADVEDDED